MLILLVNINKSYLLINTKKMFKYEIVLKKICPFKIICSKRSVELFSPRFKNLDRPVGPENR